MKEGRRVTVAQAWYAVGCYYFLTKKFDQARYSES